MSERITKSQRWVDLVSYLIGRRFPVTVADIMERIPAYSERWSTGTDTDRASVRRTFERDKDELRELGILIETVRHSSSFGLVEEDGYLLTRRDFYLPELTVEDSDESCARPAWDRHRVSGFQLRDSDARAALDALRRLIEMPASPVASAARTAFSKLTFDLDPARFAPVPVLYIEPHGSAKVLSHLGTLSDAVLNRKRVEFIYHGITRGEVTDRVVEPYGLFYKQGQWYLVGHDETRSARRVFRVTRIESLTVNTRRPKSPDYEVPADFAVNDYLDRQAWELGERDSVTQAEVLFHFPASVWAERNGHGDLKEKNPDGSAVRLFEMRQTAPFLRWLLTMSGEVKLLGPPELVTEYLDLVRGVAELYDSPASTETLEVVDA